MTHTLLVAGTKSHVGKSTVVAGLCRLLSSRGVAVAPFKAQNMSNNARAVITPDGETGEIGVSQHTQARAANVVPTTDHNPVLLKPRGNAESQLVVAGQPIAHLSASAYYDDHFERAKRAAFDAHDRLAGEYDYIIAEGAGSIAEINLHHRDLANIETARKTDASILLVGDIERGGVFASLYGTLELLPDDCRARIIGCLITKFRGDRSLLEPGIESFEERTGVPILGVLPYEQVGLPPEDSLSLPSSATLLGDDDGVRPEHAVTVGVVRLPRISNFTDLTPLLQTPGVRLRFCGLDDGHQLATSDAIVVPGTKNTVDDLLALKDAGLDRILRTFSGPIVGICGGYQLLGERLLDAHLEGTGNTQTISGIGLLPVETRFSSGKRVVPIERTLEGCGPLAGGSGQVTGYEIHMGETTACETVDRPFESSGAVSEQVLGTYLHGLFDNACAREAFLRAVYNHAGKAPPAGEQTARADVNSAADRLATLFEQHVDLDALFEP
ncbi:cobyric acid synthase [Halocatena halophila]|uniref:cobyric acid synthase n=1 Tax=Halocatena halophila TaxID=2814576 RepID=UPI002ED310A8